MSRLTATLATDMRVQYRNGFYAATAVIVVGSIAMLRWLPADAAAFMLPVVILGNVITNTFYFVSGLLLLEQVEGTFHAQSVAPLRRGEYLASKVITLTALSIVESALVAAALYGLDARLIAIGAGIALCAVLFCLGGVVVALRYESINEFLLPSVSYALLLSLPALGIFGIGSAAWYVLHPVQGPLLLMQADGPRTLGWLAYAIGYPLLWIVPAYAWAQRTLSSARAT